MIKQLLILLLSFSVFVVYSDNLNSSTPKSRQEVATKDSLRTIIKDTKVPEEKVKAFISLGRIYQTSNIDSSSYYLKRALKLSKIAKLKGLEAESYSQLGILYYYTAQYMNAVNSMKEAVDIFKEINDSNKVSDLLNNIGLVYSSINKNQYAIDYLNQSIEIKKALHDMYNTALAYLNVGSIYMNMGKDSIAMLYMQKALPTFEQMLNSKDSVDAMSGMAYCYNNIGQIFQRKNELLEALVYYKKSINYLIKVNDVQNLTLSYINIASVGLDIAKNKKGENKREYLKDVKEYLDKAIISAKKLQDYNNLFTAYKSLSVYYKELNDFENAYKFNSMYISLRDSIMDKQKLSEIENSEERYQNIIKQAEIDKNSIEIKKNEEIIKKQKQMINMGTIAIIIFVILIVMIIFYLRDNRKKSRAILQKNKEIEYINKNLNDSLKIANIIQQAVLGEYKNKNNYFSDFFLINKPKELVGGDFTWEKIIDDNVFIAVADCVGHGVPGAMVSMISNNFLHYSIKHDKLNKDVGAILTELRDEGITKVLQRNKDISMIGLDLSLIKFNRITFELDYAGANLPIYIVSENELDLNSGDYKSYEINGNKLKLYEIKHNRMPLGNYEILEDFISIKLKLNKKDRIYMFSDGFADQFGGENDKKFKYRYFKYLILTTADKTFVEQKQIINNKFTEWIGDREQVDDITILGLEV